MDADPPGAHPRRVFVGQLFGTRDSWAGDPCINIQLAHRAFADTSDTGLVLSTGVSRSDERALAGLRCSEPAEHGNARPLGGGRVAGCRALLCE